MSSNSFKNKVTYKLFAYKLLYHGKEKIHNEIELIIYKLKWYSPTSIISLALLALRPKLVLLLTDVLPELSLSPLLLLLSAFILPR